MRRLSFLKKRPAAPQPSGIGEITEIRKQILKWVFLIALIVGALAYFSSIFTLIQVKDWTMLTVQSIVFGGLIILTVFDRLPLTARTLGLLFIILLLAVSEFIDTGLVGEGRIFLVTFTLLAMVLLDFRQASYMFALSIVILVIIAVLMSAGILPAPEMSSIDDSSKAVEWVTGGAIYILVTSLITAGMVALVRGMQRALNRQAELAHDLETERSALEGHVTERTTALEQRAVFMQIVADFSRDLQKLSSREDILGLLEDYLRRKMRNSDIGIFLPDERSRTYTLVSTTGSLADEILQANGNVWTRQPGSLAVLFETNDTQVVRNAGEHSLYFHQPAFSQLQVVILLPLRTASSVAGSVCLFYTDEPDTEEGQLQTYQNLADLAASALEKASLLSTLQKNVEELRLRGRDVTRKNWRGYIKSSRKIYGVRYDREKIEPVAQHSQQARLAFRERRVIVSQDADTSKPTTSASIPIMLRDEPFGVIDVRFEGEQIPENLVNLVQAASSRLALALENARLMDQVQTRAEREHAISSLSARIRSSSDVNGILQVAAAEIARSFGASEVLVQLRSENEIHQPVENS